MFAWYITRVNNKITKVLYLLCAFSMVVPFQMVMFTLSSMADTLHLNTPWTLWVIYLGFGAGAGGIHVLRVYAQRAIDMEEASMIGRVAIPCRPTSTSYSPCCAPPWSPWPCLEAMWIWNDYLLPTLILDINEYKTIPMLIQMFRGSYGRVEMGPMMACIMLAILPIVAVYLIGQKHIIKGVVAGAVKG